MNPNSLVTLKNTFSKTLVVLGLSMFFAVSPLANQIAYASCTVGICITNISLSDSPNGNGNDTLTVSGSDSLLATLTPSNASDPNVTWSTSNPTIATVSDVGFVTGIAVGTVTITATAADGSGVIGTVVLTVNPAPTGGPVIGINITDADNGTVSVGSTDQLSAAITPSYATNQTVTWSSNNPLIAAINANGVVTGVSVGSVRITATANDGSGIINFQNLSVVAGTPTLSITNSPVIYSGAPQAATVTGSVPGTVSNIEYNGSATVPTVVGTYAVTANFAPTDATDYDSLTNASAGNFIIGINTQNGSTNLATSSNSGGVSAVVPSTTQASATQSGTPVTFNISAGTTITGPSTWNGSLTLPVVSSTFIGPSTLSGFVTTVVSTIEMGAGNTPLTFDKGVRIDFSNEAGDLVGWSQNGTFTPITAACADDSQATGDALAAGADCKINSGSDLVVWTKHFTTFITYTQTAISTGGGGGGGGVVGGGPLSIGFVSGGQVLGTGTGPVITAISTTATTSTQGQVLGASAYNFTANLSFGSNGQAVTQLQQFLTTDGDYTGPVTGYFGPLTEAGVKIYQQKEGIIATGFVGPITRGSLNKGIVSTTVETSTSTTTPSYIFTSSLSLGSSGPDVTALQTLLTKEGYYNGPVTGHVGPITQAAIVEFQAHNNLPQVGVVGPKTRAILNLGVTATTTTQ